jgi:hypothetical protein
MMNRWTKDRNRNHGAKGSPSLCNWLLRLLLVAVALLGPMVSADAQACLELGTVTTECSSDGGVIVSFEVINLSDIAAQKLFLPDEVDDPEGSATISPSVTIFTPALPGDGSVVAMVEFFIDGATDGAVLEIPFALMHKDDAGDLQECCNGTLDIGIPDDCDATQFVRGDSNQDGDIDIADAVSVLNYLFNNSGTLCIDANDVNDSGTVSITDAVNVLCFIFCPGTPLPPTPFPECGPDPTPDPLGCVSFPSCQ